MHGERYEISALYLIGGMALGLGLGGNAFPQLGIMLGDTVAGVLFAATGTLFAGLAHTLVARLAKHR